jgi:predicted nucleotidyltransferase
MAIDTLTKKEILGFLRKNKDFFKKEFGVEAVILFGSYARGEETSTSDIDILIDVKKKSFDNRIKFKEFLEEYFKRKVDVLYRDSVRRFIMRNIKDELIYA